MSSKMEAAQTLCKVYKSRVLWQAETLYYVQKRSHMISLIRAWYIKVLWASQAYQELTLIKILSRMEPTHREIISPSSFLNLRMKIWSLLLNSWYVQTLIRKLLSQSNITQWFQDQIWQTLGYAWLVIGIQGYWINSLVVIFGALGIKIIRWREFKNKNIWIKNMI